MQHLRGPLAVQVYEAAARAALEYGDLPEYNQCQAQLGALYADNGDRGCRGEFLAYRLLYQVAHAGQSGGAAALMTTLRLVTAEVSCCDGSLGVLAAVARARPASPTWCGLSRALSCSSPWVQLRAACMPCCCTSLHVHDQMALPPSKDRALLAILQAAAAGKPAPDARGVPCLVS